ncbi:Retrovirus-related Pol polyprotein from transposon TNT 1-94-like protein [Drosera capensis]
MDVKTAFLNEDLEKEVYMKQPEGFSSSEGEHLVCKLKKSLYGLKQVSGQWYLKLHDVISSFCFVENIKDDRIYQKISGRRYQNNPDMDHWRATKKVSRYLKGTKDYMLTYRRTDSFEVIGYSDSDFAGCVDSRKSTCGFVFILVGGAVS